MTSTPAKSSRPRVLVFCRSYLVADFRAMTEPLKSRFEFHFLTDGKCAGTDDTREIFYAALKTKRRSSEIDAALEDDVRIRCRMLRRLDPAVARDLIHSMSLAIAFHLDRERPDTIFSQLTDEYVTHLVALLGAKRGIAMTQICYAYFQNRMQFFDFAYGVARQDISSPDREQANGVLQQLLNVEHRQNYHLKPSYSFGRHVQLILRYAVKKIAFRVLGILQSDPWNLHYAIIPYVAERRRISDYPSADLFRDDWESALDAERAAGKLVVYLPLGFHPESSTDYWIADRRFVDYAQTIMAIIRSLAARDDICVAVKEHVHMLGMRGNGFYKELSGIANVVSIAPTAFSNHVLTKSDCVLIGTGSVGIEAMVHDTPVFSVCDTSYWFAPTGACYLDLDDLARWPEIMRSDIAQHRKKDESRKLDALCEMLSSTSPSPRMGRVWPIVDPQGIGAALIQALSQPPPQNLSHAAARAAIADRYAAGEEIDGPQRRRALR